MPDGEREKCSRSPEWILESFSFERVPICFAASRKKSPELGKHPRLSKTATFQRSRHENARGGGAGLSVRPSHRELTRRCNLDAWVVTPSACLRQENSKNCRRRFMELFRKPWISERVIMLAGGEPLFENPAGTGFPATGPHHSSLHDGLLVVDAYHGPFLKRPWFRFSAGRTIEHTAERRGSEDTSAHLESMEKLQARDGALFGFRDATSGNADPCFGIFPERLGEDGSSVLFSRIRALSRERTLGSHGGKRPPGFERAFAIFFPSVALPGRGGYGGCLCEKGISASFPRGALEACPSPLLARARRKNPAGSLMSPLWPSSPRGIPS